VVSPASPVSGAAASAGLATGGAAAANLERIGSVSISARYKIAVLLKRNAPYGSPRCRLQLELSLGAASFEPRSFVEVPVRKLPHAFGRLRERPEMAIGDDETERVDAEIRLLRVEWLNRGSMLALVSAARSRSHSANAEAT
jgi:hypothetical protein